MKRFLIAGAIVVATAGAAMAAGTETVDQKNLKFSVPALKVGKGDVVVFTNNDDTQHNITISGDGFSVSSGMQPPGKDFKVPMVKPGTYRVTCGIHPNMKMVLVVE